MARPGRNGAETPRLVSDLIVSPEESLDAARLSSNYVPKGFHLAAGPTKGREFGLTLPGTSNSAYRLPEEAVTVTAVRNGRPGESPSRQIAQAGLLLGRFGEISKTGSCGEMSRMLTSLARLTNQIYR